MNLLQLAEEYERYGMTCEVIPEKKILIHRFPQFNVRIPLVHNHPVDYKKKQVKAVSSDLKNEVKRQVFIEFNNLCEKMLETLEKIFTDNKDYEQEMSALYNLREKWNKTAFDNK